MMTPSNSRLNPSTAVNAQPSPSTARTGNQIRLPASGANAVVASEVSTANRDKVP